MAENTPQFGTAEYQTQSGSEICKSCNQALSGRYYRINGSLACERCTEQLKTQLPKDTHSAFVRGLLFGIVGFVLGLVLYSGFSIVTGIVIGYVSLAVGFIVGKAIRLGSGGIGGRRYQIAAVVLTYAAVSMSAIPIGISQYMKDQKTKPPARQMPAPSSSAPSAAAPSTPVQSEDAASEEAASSAPTAPKQKTGLGAALVGLALLGLASPFLELQDPVHGIIGLVILWVGISIAWRLTAAPKIDILGPFDVGASSPPQPLG
jgi:hypothetical protein